MSSVKRNAVQIGWSLVLGTLAYVAWTHLPANSFWRWAIPTALVAVAVEPYLSYKPLGRGLLEFVRGPVEDVQEGYLIIDRETVRTWKDIVARDMSGDEKERWQQEYYVEGVDLNVQDDVRSSNDKVPKLFKYLFAGVIAERSLLDDIVEYLLSADSEAFRIVELCAGPHQGKTSFLAQVAVEVAQRGGVVFWAKTITDGEELSPAGKPGGDPRANYEALKRYSQRRWTFRDGLPTREQCVVLFDNFPQAQYTEKEYLGRYLSGLVDSDLSAIITGTRACQVNRPEIETVRLGISKSDEAKIVDKVMPVLARSVSDPESLIADVHQETGGHRGHQDDIVSFMALLLREGEGPRPDIRDELDRIFEQEGDEENLGQAVKCVAAAQIIELELPEIIFRELYSGSVVRVVDQAKGWIRWVEPRASAFEVLTVEVKESVRAAELGAPFLARWVLERLDEEVLTYESLSEVYSRFLRVSLDFCRNKESPARGKWLDEFSRHILHKLGKGRHLRLGQVQPMRLYYSLYNKFRGRIDNHLEVLERQGRYDALARWAGTLANHGTSYEQSEDICEVVIEWLEDERSAVEELGDRELVSLLKAVQTVSSDEENHRLLSVVDEATFVERVRETVPNQKRANQLLLTWCHSLMRVGRYNQAWSVPRKVDKRIERYEPDSILLLGVAESGKELLEKDEISFKEALRGYLKAICSAGSSAMSDPSQLPRCCWKLAAFLNGRSERAETRYLRGGATVAVRSMPDQGGSVLKFADSLREKASKFASNGEEATARKLYSDCEQFYTRLLESPYVAGSNTLRARRYLARMIAWPEVSYPSERGSRPDVGEAVRHLRWSFNSGPASRSCRSEKGLADASTHNDLGYLHWRCAFEQCKAEMQTSLERRMRHAGYHLFLAVSGLPRPDLSGTKAKDIVANHYRLYIRFLIGQAPVQAQHSWPLQQALLQTQGHEKVSAWHDAAVKLGQRLLKTYSYNGRHVDAVVRRLGMLVTTPIGGQLNNREERQRNVKSILVEVWQREGVAEAFNQLFWLSENTDLAMFRLLVKQVDRAYETRGERWNIVSRMINSRRESDTMRNIEKHIEKLRGGE